MRSRRALPLGPMGSPGETACQSRQHFAEVKAFRDISPMIVVGFGYHGAASHPASSTSRAGQIRRTRICVARWIPVDASPSASIWDAPRPRKGSPHGNIALVPERKRWWRAAETGRADHD